MSTTAVLPPSRERRTIDQGIAPRVWTAEEYHLAAEAGIFKPGEKLELIDGEVLEKLSPMGAPHASALLNAIDVFHETFGREFVIRPQLPLAVADSSEPEPDITVVRGPKSNYAGRHPAPSEVCLLVEISDTTVSFDRNKKAALYADAGIQEYWIVNLVKDRLEVHRDPVPGLGYQSIGLYGETKSAAPLAAPDSPIRVAELLP